MKRIQPSPPISALPFYLSGEDQFKRKIDSSEKGEGLSATGVQGAANATEEILLHLNTNYCI
jgi:hypothetical protein